jgi:RNA polymerase sigma-70 factor (ECF subfamily)
VDADEVERTLLHRISRADRGAFRELYMHYHSRLARFVSRITRDQSELEEIINDALLIVWQQAGSFRGASRVSTWIFGIAYRCALKSVRKTSARSRTLLLAAQDGEGISEDVASSTEDRQLLDQALSCLPPEQCLVLVLAYCMEYSCEEIAAIAQCPVNTVKTRMFYARRKLRVLLSAPDLPRFCPHG